MNFKNIKSVWPVILPLILVTLGIVIIFFAFGAKSSTVSRSVGSGQYETELDETSDQGSALGSKNVIPQGGSVKVVRVVDGDTIEKTVECFGREASNKNKEIVDGKFVRLEKDVSEVDKYGRLLRYVYVDDVFVNELLVREGFAHASSYPPDVKYQDLLNSVQQEAQSQNRGLWTGCGDDFAASQTSPDECMIKGNISFSTSEKIYHMPGQEYYDKTVIDESKGERWFCAEEEAQKAGWRKSKK